MTFIHQTQLLYTDCGYPWWTVYFTLPNSVFFYFLFNDFYQKSYKKAAQAKIAAKELAATKDNNNDTMAKNFNGDQVPIIEADINKKKVL